MIIPDCVILQRITRDRILVYCPDGKGLGCLECIINGTWYSLPFAGGIDIDQVPEEIKFQKYDETSVEIPFVVNDIEAANKIKSLINP